MSKEKYYEEISKKEFNIKLCAEIALNDPEILSETIKGLQNKNDVIRFNNYNILEEISKTNPEKLYNKWDFFAELLKSENTYHKYIGIHLIANLTAIDKDNKFDELFDSFYELLKDKSIVTINHLILVSAQIIRNKSEFKNEIVKMFLNIDNIVTNDKHIDLVKGYIVDIFRECFELFDDKDEIIAFVKKQTESTSPKTKKLAKEFIKEYC